MLGLIDIVLLSSSSQARSQELSVIDLSILLPDLHRALMQYLKSSLVCAVFYVIKFTPIFVSSSECAYLSPSIRQLLFMFWHFNLIYPSSCCISHAIIDLTCKRGSVGQSEGLLIPRSSVRFRLKPENSNSHAFELHRPSIKGTKLLLKVIKAIIIIECRVLILVDHCPCLASCIFP